MPACVNASAVPPVERLSNPRAARPRPSSTTPSFLNTDTRARFFAGAEVMTRGDSFLILRSGARIDDARGFLALHVAARRAPHGDPCRGDGAHGPGIRGRRDREHGTAEVDVVRLENATALLRFVA